MTPRRVMTAGGAPAVFSPALVAVSTAPIDPNRSISEVARSPTSPVSAMMAARSDRCRSAAASGDERPSRL